MTRKRWHERCRALVETIRALVREEPEAEKLRRALLEAFELLEAR